MPLASGNGSHCTASGTRRPGTARRRAGGAGGAVRLAVPLRSQDQGCTAVPLYAAAVTLSCQLSEARNYKLNLNLDLIGTKSGSELFCLVVCDQPPPSCDSVSESVPQPVRAPATGSPELVETPRTTNVYASLGDASVPHSGSGCQCQWHCSATGSVSDSESDSEPEPGSEPVSEPESESFKLLVVLVSWY